MGDGYPVMHQNYQPTNINILIKPSVSPDPELLANNIIIANNMDDVRATITNVNQCTTNYDKCLMLSTKFNSVYDINSHHVQFYDTCGLELNKSVRGKSVLNVVKYCDVILYVMKYQDINYNAIYNHYDIFKKYNKKVYLIVTHIDTLHISDINIKNTIVYGYKKEKIIIDPANIILLNLLEQIDHKFITLINQIILRSLVQLHKIYNDSIKPYSNINKNMSYYHLEHILEETKKENAMLKRQLNMAGLVSPMLEPRNVAAATAASNTHEIANEIIDDKTQLISCGQSDDNNKYDKICFRCNDVWFASKKIINCCHDDICNECTKNLITCPKCHIKYE